VRAPIVDEQQVFTSQIAAAPLRPPDLNVQRTLAHSKYDLSPPPFQGDGVTDESARHSVANASAVPSQMVQPHPFREHQLSAAVHSGYPWEREQRADHDEQHAHSQPQQHTHAAQFPSLSNQSVVASGSSFYDNQVNDAHSEKELALLNVAIEEAHARQLSLKEQIAAVNADITAATKTLNVRRDRATDLQQVCASLQQGHPESKTVFAEAAQLSQESEGLDKMRARFFLVQSKGHKTREMIQVICCTTALHCQRAPHLAACCRGFKQTWM
jgi:hypothetical protein